MFETVGGIAYALRVAALTWAACHVAVCLWHAFSEETELREEARLLVDRICSLPRGYAAGSTLLRCDEARAVLGAGPKALIVFERAGRMIVIDAFAAARREVVALVRLLGFVGAAALALLVIAQHASTALSDWGCRKNELAATSEAHRTKGAAFVSMEDWKND